MTTRPVGHPSVQILHAFGVGKLDDSAAEAVMSHLDTCEKCRSALASQTDDGFLQRLRAAHQCVGTPAPSMALSDNYRTIAPVPGSAPTTPGLPAELIDHPQYEVVRELSRGAMGVVYLARHKLMDRLEVLKVMNKELLERAGPGAVARFLQEIRSAARLSHPNVVAAYTALQLGDLLVFAMEYVEGEDLAAVVKARGPLPVVNACYYAQQAALGLQHACDHGMVHRDIKPQNLILAKKGKKHVTKILDFGLAKVRREKGDDPGLTGDREMMGTPHFVAPEQTLDASSADIRADIYSLGCTLYYFLTGGPPFTGRSLYEILQAHHSMQARPLNLVRPDVPPELAAVVAKMMAKECSQRYQKPAEVAQALMPFFKPPTRAAQPVLPVETPAPVAPAKEPQPKPERDGKWSPAERAVLGQPTELPSARPEPPREPTRTQSSPAMIAPTKKRWLIGGVGVAACLLLIGVVGLWAGGALKVITPDGTIVLENVPADADVQVEGQTVTLTRSGDVVTVSAFAEGPHRLKVVQGGQEVWSSDVTVKLGGDPIRLRMEPKSTTTTGAPIGMKFVHLAKGTFYMGGEGGKAGQKTEIKDDFDIAVYTVTQGQWQALMDGANPSELRRDELHAKKLQDISDEDLKQFPVENVTWEMVQGFINKLNEREKGSGWVYRLPKEAEWEYACRGGAHSEADCSFDFYFDQPTNELSSLQANFDGNFPAGNAPTGRNLARTTKVGSYKPNKLGLYDMQGNVWQWCDDFFKVGATARVFRGGSWLHKGQNCRAANRSGLEPSSRSGDVGFRLARVPSGGK